MTSNAHFDPAPGFPFSWHIKIMDVELEKNEWFQGPEIFLRWQTDSL